MDAYADVISNVNVDAKDIADDDADAIFPLSLFYILHVAEKIDY